MSHTPSAVSRRHLAKGAAWTIPAVAVAASAPSLAASGSGAPGDGGDGGVEGPPTVNAVASFAEKCQGTSQVPGGWPKQGYRVVLTVTPASSPAPTITSVTLGNGSTGEVLPVAPVQLSPGVWEYVVQAASSPSSLLLTYTIADGATQTAKIPASPKCAG